MGSSYEWWAECSPNAAFTSFPLGKNADRLHSGKSLMIINGDQFYEAKLAGYNLDTHENDFGHPDTTMGPYTGCMDAQTMHRTETLALTPCFTKNVTLGHRTKGFHSIFFEKKTCGIFI